MVLTGERSQQEVGHLDQRKSDGGLPNVIFVTCSQFIWINEASSLERGLFLYTSKFECVGGLQNVQSGSHCVSSVCFHLLSFISQVYVTALRTKESISHRHIWTFPNICIFPSTLWCRGYWLCLLCVVWPFWSEFKKQNKAQLQQWKHIFWAHF